MEIKKGSLFVLTQGEYSDYNLMTVCKALVDIDILALKDEYLASNPDQRGAYSFYPYQFAKWLIVDKRVAKELKYQEWHLGSYGLGDFGLP